MYLYDLIRDFKVYFNKIMSKEKYPKKEIFYVQNWFLGKKLGPVLKHIHLAMGFLVRHGTKGHLGVWPSMHF